MFQVELHATNAMEQRPNLNFFYSDVSTG